MLAARQDYRLTTAFFSAKADPAAFLPINPCHHTCYFLNHQGMCPVTSKGDAIMQLSSPATVEQLRAFLAMIGYLHGFVLDYSPRAAPLANCMTSVLRP